MERQPRFTPGTVPLFGKQFRYMDAASFLSAHEEIISRGIYTFPCHSAQPFVIDGGANVGLATLFFKRQHPDAEIVAFEADPAIAETLEANVRTFQLSPVEVRREALWDTEGAVNFVGDGADSGRVAGTRGTEVPTRRLSEVIGNRRVDFLKLDIEGAETRVIQEAEATLFHVERLFVEYHAPSEKTGSLGILLGVLERSGFHCYLEQTCVFLTRPLVDVAPPGPFESQVNVFAWRAKQGRT